MNSAYKEGIETRSIEIARSMLNEGIKLSLISKIIGLSIEVIKNISETD